MDLDEYQEAAKLNGDAKVLLVAPPGSGKTTVLLAKIEHLIRVGGVPAGAILVLTFSRSASANLKSRFEKLRLATPFFGTIHSFAFGELKGQHKGLALITESQALSALSPLRRKYSLSLEEVTDCLGAISRQRSTGQIDETVPDSFRDEVRGAYEAYKGEHGLLDFDDLEEGLLARLADAAFRETLARRYQWVLVDEFQDLNRIQLTILKSLSAKARLFCVGDEDQCIYAFRGSDTTAMIRFGEEFPGGRILYLKYNYRSSASVVGYANAVIRNNRERYPKEILNFRQDETALAFLRTATEHTGLIQVIGRLRRLPTGRTCALIVRTNGELEAIAQALVRAGIRPALLDKVYNKYDRRILRTVIDYLEFAAGSPGRKERFLDIIHRPGLGLPREPLAHLAASETALPEDLLDEKRFRLSLSQRQRLSAWLLDMERVGRMSAAVAIRYILYAMGYYKYLEGLAQATGAPFAGMVQAVETLAEEAGGFGGTREFLRYIAAYGEVCRRRDDDCAVILSTMHGVKGMEFDEVVILNAIEGRLPHEKAGRELEAERRLYYVAVTRARHELVVVSPAVYEGIPATPSRFLAESGARLADWSGSDEAPSGRGPGRFLGRFLGRPKP